MSGQLYKVGDNVNAANRVGPLVYTTDASGNVVPPTGGGGGGGGDASAANQATIITELGDLAETAPASDTASSGLNGRLQRISQRLSTLIGSVATAGNQATTNSLVTAIGSLLPVSLGKKSAANSFSITLSSDEALPAGEAFIGHVGGVSTRVSSTLTRPSDTIAYVSGDIIASSTSAPVVQTIAGCARVNGGTGLIVNASLIDLANQATAGVFEAWVFSAAHTLSNDNAAFAPSNSDLSNLVAVIPFATSYVGLSGSGAAGNRAYLADPVSRVYKCGAGSTALYWALVVRNAYTPISAEAFTLTMSLAQD